jgi:nitrogen-specific signal transduction histidine kinase
MKNIQTPSDKKVSTVDQDFFERFWEGSWTYVKTIVDVVREPVLVLDKDLRVMAANEPFYRTFQVERKDTEGKIVYELGNGQWNITALRQLLENILPKNTFFKGFEVTHDFLYIGRKSMILNARQIHFKDEAHLEHCPEIILLAIEDVTDLMVVAETIAKHTTSMEVEILERTEKMETEITSLKKEIKGLKGSKKK